MTETDHPNLSGTLTPEGHRLAIRIYFEDTDFTGVVYHASYVRFMERGRSDYVRSLGIHHSALDAGETGESLGFAVAKMAIEFRRPAKIDDIVEVLTRPKAMRGASIDLYQTIRRGDEVLVEATVTVVLVNREGRPRRIPELLAGRLLQREDNH
jgi:acyl-CoA thioester hydrolase